MVIKKDLFYRNIIIKLYQTKGENMTLLYLNKNNKFKTKQFKNYKNLDRFIKRKGITHFYIDGFWVIRQEEKI